MENNTINETNEQMVKRLASHAGGIIEMLKKVLTGADGRLDMKFPLIYAAGLAGQACYRAVKELNQERVVVGTADGRKFYYGDSINKYLLENETSVSSFCRAVTKMPDAEIIDIVQNVSKSIGTQNWSIAGMDVDSIYVQIYACWTGIFDNMTAAFCKSPAEWPVLFGIVLQNIIIQSIQAGAPVEEVRGLAMQCAVVMSKMDDDSVLANVKGDAPADTCKPKAATGERITDKKIIDKVTGEKKGAMIALWIFLVILIIFAVGLVGIACAFLFGSKDKSPILACVAGLAIFGILIAMYISLIIKKGKHAKALREKFRLLSEDEQQEILRAAKEYGRGRKMLRSEHFVYGNLIRVDHVHKIPNNVLVFEYVKLADIAWMHLLDTSEVMDLPTPIVITNVMEGLECCVYTYKGECYRGVVDEFFYNRLMADMPAINPQCRFGYSKEMAMEFMQRYDMHEHK